MQIIETTCNRLYQVRDHADPALAHIWLGTPVRRTKAGYVALKNAREVAVRKAGSVVRQDGSP